MGTPLPALSLQSRLELLLTETSLEKRKAVFEKGKAGLELLEALKAEVDQYVNKDGGKALLAAERAFELSRYLEVQVAKALGYWALALGMTAQGRFQEALPSYEAARKLYQQEGQAIEAHRVATRQLQALAMIGDLEAALELAMQTRQGFRENQLLYEAAKVENNLGIIHARLGNYQEAIDTLQAAKEAYLSLDEKLDVAMVEINLGDTCQAMDRFQEAFTHLESAIYLLETLGNDYLRAGALLELALLYRREGRLNLVLEHLSQARELFAKVESSTDAALVQLEEARVRFEMNLLDEAEALARDLLLSFETQGMELEKLEAQTLLGSILAKAQLYDEATKVLKTARAGWRAVGNDTQRAWTEVYLLNLLLESVSENSPEIQELIDSASEAFEALNSRSGKAIILMVQAQFLQLQKQPDKAFVALQKAEILALELGIPELIIRSARLLGQHALQEGKLQAAEAYLQRAIAELEGVRASLNVDDFKAAYFGEKLDVYNDLIAIYIQQERYETAFHFVERSKSRALLDLLAKGVTVQNSSDPQVAALQKDLEEARAELNWHYLSAEKEGPGGPHWEQVRAGEKRVTSLIREIERLTPQVAALEQVVVPDLATLKAQLNENTVLLEYFSVNDQLGAFLIDREGLRCITNLAMLSEITDHLDRLNFTMMRIAQGEIFEQVYGGKEMLLKRTQAPLQALYEALLQPLALNLTGQQLVVIPYGPLNAVPFSALYDGQQYLSEQVLLSLAPSAAVYLHCTTERITASGDFVAFGVPFEDIPSVREEIEAVSASFAKARALMGAEASLATFYKLAPEASVLHIATHGLYRPDNPMFSGLRFFDGWLAARDLFNLKLNSPLVVLSACETGLSSQQASDELFGLARGFFYAGAPCLIVSLWAVKDSPTAELMVYFYEALQTGLPVARALQLAQNRLRKSHPNPYFWAAFNVLGDPGRTLKIVPDP